MNKTARRDRILEAARDRFFAQGVRRTTMQEIATDAGIAVGTIYRYFEDKDAIVQASIGRFIEEEERLEASLLASDRPAAERLREALVHRFRAAARTRRSGPGAAELTRRVLQLAPDRLTDAAARLERLLATLVDQGTARGEFVTDDPPGDVFVLFRALASFFPLATDRHRPEPEEADLLRLVDWFVDRWTPRPAPTSRSGRPGDPPG